MTSREHVYLLQMIKGMKDKLAQDAIESDSDSEIQAPTNRGNKLKQKAKFVREGKLGPPTGPSVYKEEVEHAGYRRSIISRNPPLVDEDGYDIDSDDDDERVQDAITAAAESDPYSTIRLEHLLAPLTSVTELPTHPTLSQPFTSIALSGLANQGCDLMHKENAALSKVRPLLAKLSGDHTWASCEMFLGPDDSEYFDNRIMTRLSKRRTQDLQQQKKDAGKINGTGTTEALVNGDSGHTANGAGAGSSSRDRAMGDEDVHMADIDPEPQIEIEGGASFSALVTLGPVGHEDTPSINGHQAEPGQHELVNGESELQKTAKAKGKEPEVRPDPGEDVVMDDAAGPSMNGQTQPNAWPRPGLDGVPSLLDSLATESFIHPIFLAPRSAHPDRDMGLPEQEAEDVRRLLQLYIQRQEEICRGTRKLHEGLLKADRHRKTVLGWAKAEAHCGSNRDMSDGEDWYDMEEWGLTEDLKKGQDEEEEDTTQTQKKTRNRGK